MSQRRACVKGPLSDEQVGTRHRGFHCLRMEKRSSEGSGARAMPGKVRCSWRGGSSQSAGDSMEDHLWKEHGGGSTWHRAGLKEPKRTEGDGGRRGRVAGGSVCPGECPQVSLLRLAQSSCWAPTCLLQGGDSGGGASDVPRAGLV